MNNKPNPVEIGYLCSHGHYVFYGVGDDTCGTKRIAALLVVPEVELSEPYTELGMHGVEVYSAPGFSQEDWDRTLDYATLSQQNRQDAWERG